MALLAFDGFDHYGSSTGDMLNRTGFFRWLSSTSSQIGPGRTGIGHSLNVGLGPTRSLMTSGRTTQYLGFALLASSNPTPFYSPPAVSFVDTASGTAQVSVSFNATNGIITVNKGDWGGTTLYTSPPGCVVGGQFAYVEIGLKIDPTAGWVIIKINSVTVVSLMNVSTQVASVSTADQHFFAVPGYQGVKTTDFTIDDLYLCDDSTGPGVNPCNTFLGDVRVSTLYAAANGAVAWTPLANTNWQELADIQMDGGASYNSTGTVGAADTILFAPLPTDVTAVLGVCATGAYATVAGAVHQITQTLTSGKSTFAGTATPLAANYSYITDMTTVDPATGAAWTKSAVNALTVTYTLTA